MLIENNKNTVTKKVLMKNLIRLKIILNRLLFYARSNTVEKDYFIKKNVLQDIVNERY